jgi:hypothetical protein
VLPSGFGYGDNDDRTVLEEMQGKYTTIYIRTTFAVPDPARQGALVLSVRADDGFVAFLNGKEIGRRRAGPAESFLPHGAVAETWAEEPPVPEEIVLPRDLLPGENCLALQGLNHTLESSDFSLIPVLEAEVPLDPERRTRILERFRDGMAGENAPARLAYLEGKVLEMAGEHAGALSSFRKAAAVAPGAAEPVLRIAECLRALGDRAGAVETLLKALSAGPGESRAIFEEWVVSSFRDLGKSPREMLQGFPAGSGGADLRWLLERLAAGEVIRIDCGSDEDASHDGTPWGKDRFFLGGKASFAVEKVHGVAASPASLHGTQRVFPRDGLHPAAYRVPLPVGSYRVTLHFAETFYRVARRKFDVRLEETVAIEGHEPLAKGFAVAHQETRTVAVRDGALDIELVSKHKAPAVSAIEIERLE